MQPSDRRRPGEAAEQYSGDTSDPVARAVHSGLVFGFPYQRRGSLLDCMVSRVLCRMHSVRFFGRLLETTWCLRCLIFGVESVHSSLRGDCTSSWVV